MAKKELSIKTKLKAPGGAAKSEGAEATASAASSRSPKKPVLKNFRLRDLDIQRLEEVVRGINEVSTTRMSQTDVIKGLIYLGTRLHRTKINKAIKDSL